MAFITLRQANVIASPGGTVKGSPLTNSEVDNNFANINIVIGFRENLITTANDNLVAAVNEVRSDLDNLSSSQISNGTSNVSIATTNGPIEISANLIPNVGNVINLGSDSNRFKDLFLSGNTINLGGDTISSVNGFVRINGANIFTTSGQIASSNILLLNKTGTRFVELKANASLASNVVFTFPSVDGTSGQALVTDAAGNLSFAAAGATLTDDTSTNSSFFPVITTLTSGALTTASVSSSKLSYNPSTGRMSATVFSGSGAGLSNLNAGNVSSGTLAVARGGTGVTTSTGTGNVVLSNSPTLSAPALGTPASGSLNNCTNLPIVGGTTGTLSVARGGTGATTAQGAINALAGATTSGQYLRGNGANVVMSAIIAGDVPTLNQNTTGSANTFTSTTQNSRFNSIGVNTNASGTAGEIRATNDITAFYSDRRLKDIVGPIDNALYKISKISGVYYTQKKLAESFGYNNYSRQVGVIAQEIQEVLPEAVKPAPFDTEVKDGKDISISGEKYLTVQYEKLIPLLVQAIKELEERIKVLER